MNVDIGLPQVRLLRKCVDEKLGASPRLLTDFATMAEKVRCATGERLSSSTMERFWQYSTRSTGSVSEHTLDVLSRFVGYRNWRDFETNAVTEQHPESGFISGEALNVSDLTEGSILRLSWLPDRVMTIKYLGENRFIVLNSQRSSISPGDTFACLLIQKGLPLYLDRFCKAGEDSDTCRARYVVGRENGILDIQIFSNLDPIPQKMLMQGQRIFE